MERKTNSELTELFKESSIVAVVKKEMVGPHIENDDVQSANKNMRL